MTINRYEILPEPLPRTGILYLSPPMDHSLMKIRLATRKLGAMFSEPQLGVIGISLQDLSLEELFDELNDSLLPTELNDTKALLLAQGQSLSISHMMQVETLALLLARFKSEWLVDMFNANRFFMVFQPIVSSPHPENVFGYECLMRAKSERGELLHPKPIFDIARRADLLSYLDQAFRVEAIQAAQKYNIDETLFINFNPVSIYDPVQCVRTTVQAIDEARIQPERIVFEVVESDKVSDTEHLIHIINFYRQSGFKIALDDLGAGYNSLMMMTQIKPDFIKIDMDLIKNVYQDHYKAVVVSKLIEMARNLGIKTIAEGVETKEEWLWTRENHVDFVQGYLFARPATPPPRPEKLDHDDLP